jgi:rhodanese-related sulfurtransferase
MFSGLSSIHDFFHKPYQKVGFKDVQQIMRDPGRYILINTLSIMEQECLIQYTLPYDLEERTINELLNAYDFTSKKIVIYGKNGMDASVEKKYGQLTGLGFTQVYIYPGGLFEWVLLQDIYGSDEFPTTKKVVDLLRFSGQPVFSR